MLTIRPLHLLREWGEFHARDVLLLVVACSIQGRPLSIGFFSLTRNESVSRGYRYCSGVFLCICRNCSLHLSWSFEWVPVFGDSGNTVEGSCSGATDDMDTGLSVQIQVQPRGRCSIALAFGTVAGACQIKPLLHWGFGAVAPSCRGEFAHERSVHKMYLFG